MSTKIRRGYQPAFHVIEDARSQIREMVRVQMRDATLKFIHGLFAEEIEFLCGPAFSRKGEDGYRRGGWDPGSICLEGQRMAVRKPRAKKGGKDVELKSYTSLQGFDMLQDGVLKHMMAGVSIRQWPMRKRSRSGSWKTCAPCRQQRGSTSSHPITCFSTRAFQ